MKKIFLILVAVIGFTLFSKSQTPSYIPTTNLAAWFPFNGNDSNMVDKAFYHDSLAISNSASLTTNRSGVANSSYLFNGVNSHINYPYLNVTSQSMTISLWMKINSMTSGINAQHILIAQTDGTSVDYKLFFASPIASNISLAFGVTNYVIGPHVTSTNFAVDTMWHNVVAVYDGTQIDTVNWYNYSIYVDNFLFSYNSYPISNMSDGTIANGSNSTQFIIGSDFNGNNAFDGKIDDVAIWDRVLTPSEISAIWIGNPTNTKKISKNVDFSVYPNPTSGNLTLRYKDFLNKKISVTNSFGQNVYNTFLTSISSDVDLSFLPKGIYVLNIFDNTGKIDSKKIVLN